MCSLYFDWVTLFKKYIFSLYILTVSVYSIETHTVNDDASLSRHTKRLQEELAKTTPDLAIVKDLMDAEFFARRQWIIKLDVRTRIREARANKVPCSWFW